MKNKVILPNIIAKYNGVDTDASGLLKELILILPYWRLSGELERLDANEELSQALESNSEELILSSECVKHVKQAMALEGQGIMIQFAPLTNHLFLKILRSFVVAEPVKG